MCKLLTSKFTKVKRLKFNTVPTLGPVLSLIHSKEANLADIWAARTRYEAIPTVSIDLRYRSLPNSG